MYKGAQEPAKEHQKLKTVIEERVAVLGGGLGVGGGGLGGGGRGVGGGCLGSWGGGLGGWGCGRVGGVGGGVVTFNSSPGRRPLTKGEGKNSHFRGVRKD